MGVRVVSYGVCPRPRPGTACFQALAGKIFFIRAHRAAEKVSGLLAASAFYLSAYYGENDGMVEVTDQWIPGTGKVIATLDADHFAFVVASPVSAQPPSTRRAFPRALLMQIADASDRDKQAGR